MSFYKADTLSVRQGIDSDIHYGAVIPPIHLSSTFSFAGFGEKRDYDYTRSGNPTRDQLATALADLEGGACGVITSSGMAAANLVLELLKKDDLVLAPDDCYGGCRRLLNARSAKGHFNLKVARFTDTEAIKTIIQQEKPRIVWIETPSNPLLRITDVKSISDAAHQAGALVVADNTFLSPALQNPIKLGADVVIHSTTKYINGHSDVVGGAVIAKTQELGEELGWWANCTGTTAAPFDTYLTLRGLRSLHLRIRQHEANAHQVAGYLVQHPQVGQVYYPGLVDHPGHDIARSQQSGYGAIVSFTLKGETQDYRTFVNNLRLFTLAESLGGVESLIAHPATMTHAAMSEEERRQAGIDDDLFRLSVGIENHRDLIRDLDTGLKAVTSASKGKVCYAA